MLPKAQARNCRTLLTNTTNFRGLYHEPCVPLRVVATASRKLVRVKKLCRRQLLARNSVRISIRTPRILFIDLLLPLIPQVSNLQQCWCTWHKLHILMACSNYQYCVRQPASSQYCCRLPESSYSPSQYWSHGHMTGGSWRIWRCSLKLASVCCKHLTVTSHSWCCRSTDIS